MNLPERLYVHDDVCNTLRFTDSGVEIDDFATLADGEAGRDCNEVGYITGRLEDDTWAFAERVAACYNALVGLNPAAVAGVVEFIERWSAIIDTGHNEGWAQEFVDEARSALTALRGGK